jgi:hypothetical protein
MDPMEIDPGQLKIAFRSDERINVLPNTVFIALAYKTADGEQLVDDQYLVNVARNRSLPPELLVGRVAGEALTVLELAADDALRMRMAQTLIKPFKDKQEEGDGSFTVSLKDSVCVLEAIPQGPLLLDVFLQTDPRAGYFMFMENVDLREQENQVETNLDTLPQCEK